MKVLVLYHPNSEQEAQVSDFARDYERFKAKKLDLVSLETKQGADYASLYDITSYPAFLAITDSGFLLNLWQGSRLPTMDQLDYYTHDQETHDYSTVTDHRLHIIQPPGA